MLEAELRGKTQGEFWKSEDLLTSSVFGLLQYVPPNIFWRDLLRKAILCNSISFIDKCNNFEININRYEKLEIHFWPVHSIFGEPDLILVFSGNNQLPLCFIIEAKIGANKSGEGEYDQLNRYLNALMDVTWLRKVTGLRSD